MRNLLIFSIKKCCLVNIEDASRLVDELLNTLVYENNAI